ncbi:MAG TPA: response regulator [Candidatus Limnocylindria bacterium]|jgi:PAS domain S-box-containing protein|nr:response regulator [Candidatus Limnocylindria bacterium]
MKTVLIIEDNEQNLYLARFMLEQRGFRVEAASDGPAGISAALRLLPSLILLDIQLPGMDGHEVARQLRSHAGLLGVPIVAVTSYAMPGDRERILAAGCTAYMEKPIDPERFLPEIESLLAAHSEDGTALRVLVVDDLEANRYLLEALLRSHGCKVARSSHGAEALDLARLDPPDLIITDILMPVMDGFTLCREWRGDPRLAEVPFVFYTATYTSPEDEQLAMNLGADLFLIKPVEPDILMPRLRELMAAHREGRLTRTVPPPEDEPASLREYNAALVRKLEDKMRQLESLNRQLEQRVRERTTELEAANRELQALSHVGTWTSELKPFGRLTWSPETHRIFGLPPEAFDGRSETFFALVHPDDLDSVRAASRDAWAGLRPLNVEHRVLRAEGRVRWVHEQAELERDAQGLPVRLVGIVRDITDQRVMAEQLRQAQKMEAVGQLAGGVAHDFNNLLTVVQGHASLLLAMEGISGSAIDSAQQIGEAAERASALTRQLLTFSRRQLLRLRPLDLNHVVAGMTRMLRRIVGEHITLRESLASTLPRVLADTGMMEQVIMNLVVNARDAMSKGGELSLQTSVVELDAAAAAQAPAARAGRYVLLTVSDTGTGIAPEHLPHIFEPFFTTKGVGHGTGLGLATVYGIIQQHQGWITIVSEPGRGAQFSIFLPTTEEQPEAAPATTSIRVPGGGETILVAEDEAALRQLVQQILGRHGYRVLLAENAAEALQLWRQAAGQVDLLLTDLVMPGELSGRELAELLLREQPTLKVIFTSGYSAESLTANDLSNATTAFLQKPYRPEKLVLAVRECLDPPAKAD